VTLRETAALDEWVARVGPSSVVEDKVRRWVAGLDTASWQYPSSPFPDLMFAGDYEVRSAVVPDSGGVEVFYRHDFVSDDVDLIWVG